MKERHMPDIKLDPKDAIEKMTPEEKEARRKALTAELDSLRPAVPQGAQPGDRIGAGVTAEYVPYSKEWFLDVEARKKDTYADGSPKFPGGYELHSIIAPKDETIIVGGVAFGLLAGRPCKLPTPHYEVYMDSMRRRRENDAKWEKQPGDPQFTVHKIEGVWQKTPIE